MEYYLGLKADDLGSEADGFEDVDELGDDDDEEEEEPKPKKGKNKGGKKHKKSNDSGTGGKEGEKPECKQ